MWDAKKVRRKSHFELHGSPLCLSHSRQMATPPELGSAEGFLLLRGSFLGFFYEGVLFKKKVDISVLNLFAFSFTFSPWQ